MTAVFERMLEMSAMAAVVIAVVMLIRLLLRKAPRKYSYALWSVAAFRLVCPVSFKSMFSIFRLADMVERTEIRGTIDHTILDLPYDVGTSPVPSVSTPPVAVTTPAPTVSVPPSVNVETLPEPEVVIDWASAAVDIAAVIWLVGLAALLIYGIVSYIRLRRRMSTAVLLEGNVWQSDRVQSPFILGFIRPKIYLPFGLGEEQQHYVLAHERYHLNRLDHIVRPLSFLILAVHWFNPLVWVAYYMMSRDMEMSCDEKVLSGADNIRKAYSITLLSFAANRRFPSPSPLAFGESGVKGRIKNVLNWKKPRTWVTVIAIIVCIVVIIVCAANPASHPRDWTKDLTVEDVDWAELSFYTEQWNYRRLSGEELEELVELLNGLRRREMKQPPPRGSWGFPSERMVTICCNGVEYKLNLGPSPMTLICNDEAVAWGNDDPWFVGDEVLKQFIRDLPEGEAPTEPSDGYYQSVECIFMSSLSSVVGTADSGFLYLLGSDGEELRLISKNTGVANTYTADRDWQELSEEFLHKMEFGTIVLGENDLWGTLREQRPMIRLYVGDYKFLLNFGDELWEGTYAYDHNGNISLWSLYRLEPVSVISDALNIPAEYQLLFAALGDRVEIVDTGLGMTDVLSNLVEAISPDVEMEITNLAAVDLDGDGVKELLLLIETPGTVYGTKILRYNAGDGQIYAYVLWYRAFMDVKTDGTFAYSGGAADNGFGRISFTADGYEVEKITYSESRYPDHEVNCYVNGEPATEQEFVNAFAAWQETPGVTWIEYDPVNALRLLWLGEPQEMPPATYCLSADLTHDGVDEIVTIRQETDEVPIIHSVIVSDSNGKELWRGEVSDWRGGHNGFYLYERDGKHYIMQWVPDAQQGWYNFNYKVFSFSRSGEINVLAENALQYDLGAYESRTLLAVDLDELRAFEAEVNALLKNATPLLVIHDGKTLIGKFSTTDQWKSPADDWERERQIRLEQQVDREERTLAVWPLNDLTLTVLEGDYEIYTIDVYNGNYYLWENSFSRHGEVMYFRYTENGVQYLMELTPGGSQGVGMWSYSIFSVGPEYNTILRENSLLFTATSAAEVLAVDMAALQAFVNEVNGLLEHVELIAEVSDGRFSYGTPGMNMVYRWDPPLLETVRGSQNYWREKEQELNRLIAEQCNTYYVRNLMQPGGKGHGQFVVLDQYLANKGTTAWVVFSFIETDGDGNFIAEYSNIPMMITCDIVDGEFVLTETWVEEKGKNFDAHDELKERFPPAAAQAVIDQTYVEQLRQSAHQYKVEQPAYEVSVSAEVKAPGAVLGYAANHIIGTHPNAQTAQIDSLEKISTAAVGTTSGHQIYRFAYSVMLDGAWQEQEAIYLVLHHDWSSSSDYWYTCGAVTQQEIDTIYSTEAMMKQYNNDPYLAAAVETVKLWRSSQ